MAYITRAMVEAVIPASVLSKLLDDNGDGQEDSGLFDTLVSNSSAQVDGFLSTRYLVPISDPAPEIVQQSTLMLLCESLYQRNGVGVQVNPWTTQATQYRSQLQKIGRGEIPLSPNNSPATVLKGAAFRSGGFDEFGKTIDVLPGPHMSDMDQDGIAHGTY